MYDSDKRSDTPKAVTSYTPAPSIAPVIDVVTLCKPAHSCEGAFTDKTGGCNSEADVVEITLAYKPARGT